MPIQPRRIAALVVLSLLPVIACSEPVPAQALADAQKPDPAVESLAARLADGVHQMKAKRVGIFEVTGPQYEVHAAGKWLARQLCNSLHARDLTGPPRCSTREKRHG